MLNFMDKVVYQIYPKSFQDSNGDGIGDLGGIIQRLDYLQSLGVDMLWINPIYPSPQNDDGYDVMAYTDIDPRFGTLADFDRLVHAARDRHMGIMMDMVFNHCSTQHPWFQRALAGESKYQDYFYIRPPKSDGSLPTNWASKFGGVAWAPFGETGNYYLHLYDPTQADLNWHNPEVRQALAEICRFWLHHGVQGFRFDVLNVIGKDQQLVDSPQPNSPEEKALYTDRPLVHQWIKELHQQGFRTNSHLITVGEMSSTSVPAGIKYTNPEREELSMIFNFHHLKVDYPQGKKWITAPVDWAQFKAIISEWQIGMAAGGGWNSLFLNNHDQPRAVSRFGDDQTYRFESATLLAQSIHFLRGTPYIYQGEEIGMTNARFSDPEHYGDVETSNAYQALIAQGTPADQALAIIQQKSRSNARTPMQWDRSPNAGFSTGTPWMAMNPNYPHINVASDQHNAQSIFHYYQALIRLRKQSSLIQTGDIHMLLPDNPHIFAYLRENEMEQLLQLGNVTAIPQTIQADALALTPDHWHYVIGNGQVKTFTIPLTLAPYETIAFKRQK